MSETVASFTIVIIKGGVYQKTFAITDEGGTPIPLNSAQIDVEPNGATNFSWTQANGKFTLVSPGVYDLNLTASDTTAFTWESGTYRMVVEDADGDANPCLIEGNIFAKNC